MSEIDDWQILEWFLRNAKIYALPWQYDDTKWYNAKLFAELPERLRRYFNNDMYRALRMTRWTPLARKREYGKYVRWAKQYNQQPKPPTSKSTHSPKYHSKNKHSIDNHFGYKLDD